jgi:hypothetical protein
MCVANEEGFVENTLSFVKAGPMMYVNFILIAIIVAEKNRKHYFYTAPCSKLVDLERNVLK